jgi:hypothetical protein
MVENEFVREPCEQEIEAVNAHEGDYTERNNLSRDVITRPGRLLKICD